MLATKPDLCVGALDLCVHQMFEKQSERMPESIAVFQNNEVLKYLGKDNVGADIAT